MTGQCLQTGEAFPFSSCAMQTQNLCKHSVQQPERGCSYKQVSPSRDRCIHRALLLPNLVALLATSYRNKTNYIKLSFAC